MSEQNVHNNNESEPNSPYSPYSPYAGQPGQQGYSQGYPQQNQGYTYPQLGYQYPGYNDGSYGYYNQGYATAEYPSVEQAADDAKASSENASVGESVAAAVGNDPAPEQKTAVKPKHRFSTPAVAAMVVAAAIASGGITGALVSNGGGASTSNTAALSALQSEPVQTANTNTAGSVQGVAAKVLPSVVSISVMTSQGGDSGSGSILSADGTVITNNHVVSAAADGKGKITVTTNDSKTYPAEIVARDPETDIAVIKMQNASGLTPITLGDSSKLAVGQEVVAIGSPLGLDATVTSGIVSATNRPVQAQSESSSSATMIDAIQTDAAINPGNSGGALVDMDGNLIGIPSVIATLGSSGTSSQSGSIGLGFAIPVNQARTIAEQLIKNGKAEHPAIGVTVSMNSQVQGAQIVDVPAGSAAEKGGLKKGDVVTKVDDVPIASGAALIASIRSHAIGDTVTLTVTDTNGDNEHTVSITLSAQESSSR